MPRLSMFNNFSTSDIPEPLDPSSSPSRAHDGASSPSRGDFKQEEWPQFLSLLPDQGWTSSATHVMNPNASPDEHQRHMQTGRAKLVKRNKKQARSSEGARQVRDCIVSGFEPDRKLKVNLSNPAKARDILTRLRSVQVTYATDGVPARDPSQRVPPIAHLKPRAICLSRPAPVCPQSRRQRDSSSAGTTLSPEEHPARHLELEELDDADKDCFVNLFSKFNISPKGQIIGTVTSSSEVFDYLGGATSRILSNRQLRLPQDRITVISNWWGYELAFPAATMHYLREAKSVSGPLFTFLQGIASFGGMPELLPFLRYISAFVQFQFSVIAQQDRGFGVILAATWVMPIAIIPRAWDFSLMPLAPPSSSSADSHHEQPMRDRSSALPNVMYPVEPRPFPFTDIRSGETPQTDPSYQVSSSPAAVTFAEPPDTSQDAEETSDKAAAAQQDQEEFALLPPPNQRSPGERPAIEPRSSSAMQNFMTPPETPAVDVDPHTEGLTHKPSRTPSEHIPHWNRSSFLSTNSTSTNGSFKGSEVSYGMEEDSHSLPGQRDQLGSTPPLL